MVMQWPAIHRFGRLAAPRFAVLGIEIPLPASGITVRLQQHAVPAAHVPVKIFHAPLFLAGEQIPGFESVGEKVHAGSLAALEAASGKPGIELRIQTVFIRGLPFKAAGLGFDQHGIEIFGQVLVVIGSIDGDVADAMSSRTQLFRQ